MSELLAACIQEDFDQETLESQVRWTKAGDRTNCFRAIPCQDIAPQVQAKLSKAKPPSDGEVSSQVGKSHSLKSLRSPALGGSDNPSLFSDRVATDFHEQRI
eukprot:g12486.t1